MRIDGINFVAFDTDIAEFMTDKYHIALGTEKQKPIVRELNLPGDGTIAREWITKDLMLIGTGDFYQCDTIM